jgi:hypothetical protein
MNEGLSKLLVIRFDDHGINNISRFVDGHPDAHVTVSRPSLRRLGLLAADEPRRRDVGVIR